MKTPRKPHRSASEWQRIVDTFNSSGMPSSLFCAQNDVSSASLYKWRQYFSKNSETGSAKFLEITPSAPCNVGHSAQSVNIIEIEIAGNILLRIRHAS